MAERHRGLGRGLSALMGENAEAPVAPDAPVPAGVQRVPIESLKPNPDQPRKTFRQEDLEELTASIRDKGVLQPILVRSRQPPPQRPVSVRNGPSERPKPVKAKAVARSGEGSADVVALQQDLADPLGLKVELNDRSGKGELTIRYGSLEQLDDLCRRLMRG